MPLPAQPQQQTKTTEDQQFRDALADVGEIVDLLSPYYATSTELVEAVRFALTNSGQARLFLTMLQAKRDAAK